MSKALLYASSFRESQDLHADLLEGVEQIALAVGSTLGPRGCNVIIDRAGDVPQVTKDGVTVARNIQVTNPVHQAAIKMIQAVARATVEEAGDGTTTATVLAHAILKEGLARVREGDGAVALQRSIQAAVSAVSDAIRAISRTPTDEQIAQVATIATNGNEAFGQLILDALRKVGRDGLYTIDDANKPEMSIEIREGFQIDQGFLWPDFITDREHGLAVLENPYILITERQLSQGIGENPTLHDPGPLLSFCAGLNFAGNRREREPRPLLIIADDVLAGSDAAQSFLVNHAQKNLQICIVRAPGYGDLKRALLSDIAMATGGRVLTMDGGDMLSRWVIDPKGCWTDENLGSCARVIVSNRRTILEGCRGDRHDKDLVSRFAAGLREQAKDHPDPATREHMLRRAAQLTGKVAVLKVGAQTEAEAKALRDAAEDAVLAVRCAVSEGIVPGGGLALYLLGRQLHNSIPNIPQTMCNGALIVAKAIKEPLRLIARHAGEDPDEIEKRLTAHYRYLDQAAQPGDPEKMKGRLIGFNAATGRFEDMIEAGIVDPAKVVRVALEKAASIAALMLTTSCLIYFDPEANKMPPMLPLQGVPHG